MKYAVKGLCEVEGLEVLPVGLPGLCGQGLGPHPLGRVQDLVQAAVKVLILFVVASISIF